MKYVAALAAFCCSITVLLGQRIDTNADPSGELQRLFPKATAFSPLSGYPLHYVAYGPPNGAAAETLGYAFWTTDLVPSALLDPAKVK